MAVQQRQRPPLKENTHDIWAGVGRQACGGLSVTKWTEVDYLMTPILLFHHRSNMCDTNSSLSYPSKNSNTGELLPARRMSEHDIKVSSDKTLYAAAHSWSPCNFTELHQGEESVLIQTSWTDICHVFFFCTCAFN